MIKNIRRKTKILGSETLHLEIPHTVDIKQGSELVRGKEDISVNVTVQPTDGQV